MSYIELNIKSTLDGTVQPSLFFPAKGKQRPLLVGLHTWSFDRFNQIKNMLPYAEREDFNLLLPEFRGPNTPKNSKPTEACGSELAKRDVRDAIDYCLENYDVDKNSVFLLGLSGGGHMALLMAGYCPEYFRAIGAYVPITDLARWREESPSYRSHIDLCCGGSLDEMKKRSPVSYIDTVATANLKIFHGKYDRTVPFTQSLNFWLALNERHPDARVYLDIFDGGHEIDMEAAMHWLLSEYKAPTTTTVTG